MKLMNKIINCMNKTWVISYLLINNTSKWRYYHWSGPAPGIRI